MLLIDRIEVHRDEGRVPVIAVNDVRAKFITTFDKRNRTPRQQNGLSP